MIDLLRANGRFYKANLHCHTVFSDGKMTARQVKDWYKGHGYSIVAFTDHSKYRTYPELNDADFLAVPGFEAAFTCLDPVNKPLKYRLCHINFLARDPETSEYELEEHTYNLGVINRYIARMKQKGWLCTLNHPGWSLQSTEEINGIDGLDGFEVYNNGAAVLSNNGDGQAHYTLFLNDGKRAWAVATDDNHAGFREDGQISSADDTLGGFIMISMPALGYAEFAEAFEHGRFYASTGPEIKSYCIDEERDCAVVDCSPVAHVLLKGIHTVRAAGFDEKTDSITHVEIPLAPVRAREPYFRLEVMRKDGGRAYSQPYWFEA